MIKKYLNQYHNAVATLFEDNHSERRYNEAEALKDEAHKWIVNEHDSLVKRVQELEAKNQVLAETILEYKDKEKQLESEIEQYKKLFAYEQWLKAYRLEQENKILKAHLKETNPYIDYACYACKYQDINGHADDCTHVMLTKEEEDNG